MTKTNFSCDSCSFVKVVYKLRVIQGVMVNVFWFENPFKIEARWGRVFIVHPTSLFESFLNIWITSSANEYFHVIIYFKLLFPSCKISDVGEDDFFWVISFQEWLKGSFLKNLLLFGLWFISLFLLLIRVLIRFTCFLFLQFFQPRLIRYLLEVLLCLLPG